MRITHTAEVVVDANPDAFFRTLSDLAALPDRNEAVTKVIDLPARLEPGAASASARWGRPGQVPGFW